MARPKLKKKLSIVISLRLDPETRELLRRVWRKIPVLRERQVAREALKLGLALILKDPERALGGKG